MVPITRLIIEEQTMKRSLYFALALMISGPLIGLVVEYFLRGFGIQTEGTQPIIALLTGFFWVEYFRVMYKEKGLWEISSRSIRDRLSLVLHLLTCTFLTGWTYHLDVMPIYRVIIWLFLLLVTALNFYLCSTQEAKPFIKKYFSAKW